MQHILNNLTNLNLPHLAQCNQNTMQKSIETKFQSKDKRLTLVSYKTNFDCSLFP